MADTDPEELDKLSRMGKTVEWSGSGGETGYLEEVDRASLANGGAKPLNMSDEEWRQVGGLAKLMPAANQYAAQQVKKTEKRDESYVIMPLNQYGLEDYATSYGAIDQWLLSKTNNIIGIQRLIDVASVVPILGNVISAISAVSSAINLLDNPSERSSPLNWIFLVFDGKRHPQPPKNQLTPRSGSNSSILEFGKLGSLSSVSSNHANGSIPFALAVANRD